MAFLANSSRSLLLRAASSTSSAVANVASRTGGSYSARHCLRFYADNASAAPTGSSSSAAQAASSASSQAPATSTADGNDLKDLGSRITPSAIGSSSTPSSKSESLAVPGMEQLRPGPSTTPTARRSRGSAPSSSSYGSDQEYTLHIRSTRNNVQLTYTHLHPTRHIDQKVFRTITGGSDKDFKKSNRSSYEAAHQAAIKTFGMIEEHVASQVAQGEFNVKIKVAFKGMFGQGREAVTAALTGPEGVNIQKLVTSVEDRTPIKIGGTRPKKQRRL